MKSYSLTHLTDQTLLRDFDTLVAQDDFTNAAILAHLAEMDDRRLYLAAGYDSMFSFLVREKHLSEETAYRRIRVARAARRFPAIFPALAEGRLNMTTVLLLSPHLTQDTADQLLAAAEHKTKVEIELVLAERFPRPDLPTIMVAIAPAVMPVALPVEVATRQLAPSDFRQLAPEPVATITEPHSQPLMTAPMPRARVAPLSPGRNGWQLTVDDETQVLYDYTAALLGHSIPSGDMPAVIKRSLQIASRELEREMFAKCVRSRPRRGAPKGRYVSAEVRRTVWQRDGGQCTFTSADGKRCGSTTRLEFDHIDPVARGGTATADRMRLRCRAHNQYEAECAFGAGFMQEKREAARRSRQQSRAQREQKPPASAQPATDLDVRPWLRQLGFSAEEARRGAALCVEIPDAPIEQRVKVALRGLAPRCSRLPAPMPSAGS